MKKPIRIVSTRTRNRRLNEINGMVVLVGAAAAGGLALASTTRTDPSFNTGLGTYVTGRARRINWTAWWEAYLADANAPMIGGWAMHFSADWCWGDDLGILAGCGSQDRGLNRWRRTIGLWPCGFGFAPAAG